MFSFQRNQSRGKEDPSQGDALQKKDDAPENELYWTLLKLTAEPEYNNTDIASAISSSDISDLSMYSDGYVPADMEESSSPFNAMYIQTLDSFLDRLDEATNPMTPQDQALDLFNHLHLWVIKEGSNHDGSIEIFNEVFLKLLRYIRSNLDEKQCVFKAVTLIDCLSCHKGRDPLALVKADAINVLVLVLLSHNSYSVYSHESTTHDCRYESFFWRTWDILLDIVLSPAFVDYLQRRDEGCRDERQKSQRIKLLILVQFLLDVCGHSMSALRRGLMFEMLTVLLRVDHYGFGSLEPNDEIRSSVSEMKIAWKCQLIVVMQSKRNDCFYL